MNKFKRTNITVISEKRLLNNCCSLYSKYPKQTYKNINYDKLDDAFICIMEKRNMCYRSYCPIQNKYALYTMIDFNPYKQYYIIFNKNIDYSKYEILPSIKKFLEIDNADDVFFRYIPVFCDNFIYEYDDINKKLHKVYK